MNYKNTFMLVADDCPAEKGIVPIAKEGKAKPIHAIQYDIMSREPYTYTQEDILFMVHAERNHLSKHDTKARKDFFEKSHPCLRTSALGKKYGWGIHFNEEGKAALFSKDSQEYISFQKDEAVSVVKAMRNRRA
jgi:hypothetical protein